MGEVSLVAEERDERQPRGLGERRAHSRRFSRGPVGLHFQVIIFHAASEHDLLLLPDLGQRHPRHLEGLPVDDGVKDDDRV